MPEDNNYDKLFSDAKDIRSQPNLYVNGIRISGDLHELILDFFNITPNPETGNQEAMSYLLTRITMNYATAQKLSNILLGSLSKWENVTGQSLSSENRSIDEDNTNES